MSGDRVLAALGPVVDAFERLGVPRVQAGRLDLDSMKQWAPALAVADLLERAFADAAR